MAHIETYILVPKYYNEDENGNRKLVERSKFKKLQQLYIENFGGLTIEEKTSTGFWVNEQGKVVQDETYKYIVAIQSWTDVPKLIEIAKFVKEEWKQDAVYINIAGIPDFI